MVVASITPVLTVRSTAAAVEFYEAAFGAIEISRVEASDGQLVIDLAIGHARFRVVDEAPKAFNLSPETLGGTSVRLNLLVEDPDATAAQAVAAGAVEVFPIADQPYGLRQGRFADPFGHHWLIGKPLPGDRLGNGSDALASTATSRAVAVRRSRKRSCASTERWISGR